MTTDESDYQRAWRERGEVEAAILKWNNNQRSPAFTIGVAVIGGLASLGIVVAFVQSPSWAFAPILLLGAMFGALPLLSPFILRDEAKARAEAKATLERLGFWHKVPSARARTASTERTGHDDR